MCINHKDNGSYVLRSVVFNVRVTLLTQHFSFLFLPQIDSTILIVRTDQSFLFFFLFEIERCHPSIMQTLAFTTNHSAVQQDNNGNKSDNEPF